MTKRKCKRFRKYAGSTDVPCFICYVSKANDSKFDGKTYIVRAVSVQRFIEERILQGKTCYLFDYTYEELPHGELYRTFPNL